ncbi:MAG TPA: hypothetical protein VNS58_29760 [Puia sp.]|nr:hypothetical protein [Puia sp.]
MIAIKRSYINQLFTSLAGMICFFLFALQINSQYFLPEDPSADAKDPVSIVVRVVSSASLFGTEHLPVYKEEAGTVSYQPLKDQEFYNRGPRPVVAYRLLPSLRGPPIA